jgi:hypothetical protein
LVSFRAFLEDYIIFVVVKYLIQLRGLARKKERKKENASRRR